MQKVDEVLDFLNEKLGGQQLEWQGDHTSVIFEDEFVVDLMKTDDQSLELINVMTKFDGKLTPDHYESLLIANYQGGMTGPSRLSITPGSKTLSLCCRVDVRTVSPDQFEELLSDFVKYVKFWHSEDAENYLNTGETHVQNSGPDNSQVFYTKV